MSKPTTTSCSVEILQQIEELADVPTSQLQWLIDHSHCESVAENEHFFRPDDPITHLRILLEGKIQMYIIQSGSKKSLGEFDAPFITGKLPYSRLSSAKGYGIAFEPSLMLLMDESHFPEMIKTQHELTTAFVQFMTQRVRSFTSAQYQNEKLMALGKLSAGLSHELNNPASAVVRSAQALKKHLTALPENFKNVIRIKMSDEEVDVVNELLFRKISDSKSSDLSLMERNALEDELAEFLEDRGFDDGYEVAENLANFGWETADLEEVLEKSTVDHFVPVMMWIDNNLVTEAMVTEIEEASTRIKELVQSVKGYTHMDQAQEEVTFDVHTGIKSTLTMLAHKIKKNKVQVDKQFEADLPLLKGSPGEINQVFTNLIDNALDAMEETTDATLTIKTYSEAEFIKIEITDTGSGIPADIQSRIFDPFFTTKEIGKGTGMGLEIVRKIILGHKGRIDLESDQNGTTFKIALPHN